MKATFLVGVFGFILSLGAIVVSTLLPIIEGPRISWREAAYGIVPGTIGTFAFVIVLFIGLVGLLNRNRDDEEQSHRRD